MKLLEGHAVTNDNLTIAQCSRSRKWPSWPAIFVATHMLSCSLHCRPSLLRLLSDCSFYLQCITILLYTSCLAGSSSIGVCHI